MGDSPGTVLRMGSMARIVLVAVVAAVALTTGCGGSNLDDHATKACDLVADIDAGKNTGLISAVVDEAVAVKEASKSTVEDLRSAANTESPASSLDPSNPLYENPGDVRFNAVAAWCRRHA